VRGAVIGLVLAAVLAAGCSSAKHGVLVPASTAPTSAPSQLSATAGDRELCAAYDAFWNAPYSGGEPDASMQARERTLVSAAQATPDPSLPNAVRDVIDGELGLPKFYLHDTAQQFRKSSSTLSTDARAALTAVEQGDRLVRSKCRAVGRPVAG